MNVKHVFCCLALALTTSIAIAQTDTTFTYQGELIDNGVPANGPFHIAFALFDADVGGSLIGIPIFHAGVPVVDGKFTVPLDFGHEAFEENRWMEIEVNGHPLSPRTPITHAPYAIQTRGIFVDHQGYVGLGNNTPAAGLDIEHPAGYGSAVALNNTGGGIEWRLASWTDGTFRLVKTSGLTFSPIVVDSSEGFVGMGTDFPDQKLSVHNDDPGISYIRVSDASTGPRSGLRMGLNGFGDAYIINDEASRGLALGTGGSSKVFITEEGYVGVNRTLPEMMVHIKQEIANRSLRHEHQSTTDFWDNGIGTTTKNYKFYYNNLFRADISSVDGSYTQASDGRLKRNVEPLPSVLDQVKRLKPSSYFYVDSAENAPRSIGFVAQEVEPFFPNLVRESDEGFKSLVYDGFAVISIKAIQEVDQKVSHLEAENAALQKRLSTLENMVKRLANQQESP